MTTLKSHEIPPIHSHFEKLCIFVTLITTFLSENYILAKKELFSWFFYNFVQSLFVLLFALEIMEIQGKNCGKNAIRISRVMNKSTFSVWVEKGNYLAGFPKLLISYKNIILFFRLLFFLHFWMINWNWKHERLFCI